MPITNYLSANRFTHNMESAIEHYACFEGGDIHPIEASSLCKNGKTVISTISDFLQNRASILAVERSLKYYDDPLLQHQTDRLLSLLAKGDRRYRGTINRFYRDFPNSPLKANALIDRWIEEGVLCKEYSRVPPVLKYNGQKPKRHLRTYKIDNKLRFATPFKRFWYFFISDYLVAIKEGNWQTCLKNIEQYLSQFVSFAYESLINDLLCANLIIPYIIESYSYWTSSSEIDILAHTKEDRVIVGECKWKRTKVCYDDLSKLMNTAKAMDLEPDTYLFCSKGGFSEHIKKASKKEGIDRLLLIGLDDLFRYLYE